MEANKDKKISKTLSISSTDSLLSSTSDKYEGEEQYKTKIINIEEKTVIPAVANNSEIINNKQENDKTLLLIPNETGDDDENFDYAKTGARPKKKSLNLLNSKSSLSSSASSLSSLVSQNSNNQFLTNSTTSSNSSQTNYRSKAKSSKSTNSDASSLSLKLKTNSSKDEHGKLGKNSIIENEIFSLNQMDEDSPAIDISNCPLCGKIIKGNLEKHFEAEHKEFECPFCGLLFDTEFVLNQHLSAVHDDLGESGYVNKTKNPMPSTNESNFNLTSDWVAKNTISKDIIEIDVEAEHDAGLTCPICQIKIKDELWLEIHVDSHFNENANEIGSDSMNRNYSTASFSEKSIRSSQCLGATAASSLFPLEYKQFNKSRTASASSLAANVDENFEIDQVITLSDCNMIMDDNNSIDYGDRLPASNSRLVELKKIYKLKKSIVFFFSFKKLKKV